MKHADFVQARSNFHTARAAFEELAKGQTRRYLIRAGATEVIEIVVDPTKCQKNARDLRLIQTSVTLMGAGTTDVTNRGMDQFSADELSMIAATHKAVEAWMANEIDALPESTMADSTIDKLQAALRATEDAKNAALVEAAKVEEAKAAKAAAKPASV